MKKHRPLFIGILAVLTASIFLFASCDGPNNPKGSNPESNNPKDNNRPEKKELPKIPADILPKVPEGETLVGYKIEWTDANGKQQTKRVTALENLTLEGGLKEGTKITVTLITKGADGKEKTVSKEITVDQLVQQPAPQPAGNWEEAVNKGITALENEKWDDALAQFKNAYAWERNNTTKSYYALVKLASISIKPETVNFMKNTMGFETYPGTLDALVNLKWFKEYDVTYNYGRFDTYYHDFQEDVNGGYIRVNGSIINAGQEQAGQTVIDLRSCYERNTLDGLYTYPKQTISPEWIEGGSKALYDHIQKTPKKDRSSQYVYHHWQEGKRFVVEEVSETGSFMVSSGHIPAEMIPAGTKRYSQGKNDGWVHKDYEYVRGEVLSQVKATEWGKDMHPLLYIPAYLVEHSGKKNVDALVDELYSILFEEEYTEAKRVLNSLNSTPIIVDKRLLELTGLSQYFDEDSTVEVQKEQLLGVIGGFTLAKGAFEFVQSYSFNTDLSILKFDWENVRFDEGLAQNISGYDAKLDPFNNDFLKGRNPEKLKASKQSFIEGADVLIKLYDSLTNHPNMPAEAKEEVKKLTFIKTMVTELRDAIKEGRRANLLIGEDNMLKEGFTAFELDMGKIFTYEYFKLANAFEMDGNKPKVFPAADGKPAYLQMKYKTFLDGFMKVTEKWSERDHDNNVIQVHEDDISEAWDGKIWLEGPLEEKIKEFYK